LSRTNLNNTQVGNTFQEYFLKVVRAYDGREGG
jgi:hypothetical protein